MSYYITPLTVASRDLLFPELLQGELLDSIAEQRPFTELEQRIKNRITLRQIAIHDASIFALRIVAPSTRVFLLASDWERLVTAIDSHYIRLCPELECQEAFLPLLAPNIEVFWGDNLS